MKKITLAALVTLGLGAATLTALAQDGHRGLRAEMQLEKIDLNGDGNITREEIEAGKAERFASADIDGSGAITFDEFNAFAEAEKARREAERRQRTFERLDANGDGQVSAEEHAAMKPARMERMFDRIDTDDDGVITEAEREAAHEKMKERGKKRMNWRGDR